MDHDQSLVCAEIYVKCMLPTLRLLEGSTAQGLSQSARNKAVKIAADRSLALISSGSCWSAALKEQIRRPVEENCPDTTASNQVSDEADILLGFRKVQGSNCSNMHNSVKFHFRKQKLLVNFKNMFMKARKESRSAKDSAFCQRCSRCTVTSRRQHARCIYTRNSRRSTHVNFVPKSFSSEDRSCHSRAKANSCKLSIHHKVIFKKFRRKALKKLVPKVRQVRTSSRDEVPLDRVQTLQKLVPGGATMKTDHLLHEAEDYIFFLRFQVDIMKSLLAAAHADASLI
ncbi:hypothetical protein O6H91_Y522700 [Diphasiastrum complanatum]|nr:hypothetical protein O6H91_Y522700 [Diphasiastrum complanatum]